MTTRKPATHDIANTDLLPHTIADCVVSQCGYFLLSDEPLVYADRLAERAAACYARSAHFRRIINRRGNAGRDALYAFMQHWLSAYLHKDHPQLYRRLPPRYCMGAELPLPGAAA